MSLEFAVERLYQVGWVPASGRLLQSLEDGRLYPSPTEIRREFTEAGLKLTVRHVSLFNCYRAEWSSAEEPVRGGYCVGATEAEALVFALAQLVESREFATA